MAGEERSSSSRLQKALSIAFFATTIGIGSYLYLKHTRLSSSPPPRPSPPTASSSSPPPRPSVLSSAASDFDLAVLYMRERVSSSKSQVKTAFGTLTTHEKLRLYGLYKQGSIRDGSGDDGFKSGVALLDPVASAKYAAWKAARSLSPAEARALYVEMITKLFPSWVNDLLESPPVKVLDTSSAIPELKRAEQAQVDTKRIEKDETDVARSELSTSIDTGEEGEDEEEEERNSHGGGMMRGYSSVPVYEEPPIGDRGETDMFYIVSLGKTDAARSLLLNSVTRDNANGYDDQNGINQMRLSSIYMEKNKDGDETTLSSSSNGDTLSSLSSLSSSSRSKILSQLNEFGESLFHVAADAGHTSMCEFLMNECKAAGGEEFALRVLDTQEPEGQQTALHYACSQDRLDTCKLLIKMGANRDVRDIQGKLAIDLIVGGEEERRKLLKELEVVL